MVILYSIYLTFVDAWKLADVAQSLKIDEEKAKELLLFWVKQGVLKETDSRNHIYQVMEKADKNSVKGMWNSNFVLLD